MTAVVVRTEDGMYKMNHEYFFALYRNNRDYMSSSGILITPKYGMRLL
jgi:hypothetical protein